jgi:SAM-dependent methyltransferase
MARYVLDNARPGATTRFGSLEALYDPGTFRHLTACGVDRGWHCLEVGGGGGSVAAWLAERVGPGGRITVTDIDPSRLRDDLPSTVEIVRHDIAGDPLPEGAYDLVHARLVLIHLPRRALALRRMVSALRPGGWLLVEDFDCELLGFRTGNGAGFAWSPLGPAITGTDAAAMERVTRAVGSVMTAAGVEMGYGRRLYRELCAEGLIDVGAEGPLAVGPGGSPAATLAQANIETLREQIRDSGLATEADIERALRVLADPAAAITTPGLMISARGRRPF